MDVALPLIAGTVPDGLVGFLRSERTPEHPTGRGAA
jgi:hypothetical protein